MANAAQKHLSWQTPAGFIQYWRGAHESAPVMVMLHGMESHGSWFAEVASNLQARGFAVVAWDRPGCGQSQNLKDQAERCTQLDSPEELSAQIRAFLAVLDAHPELSKTTARHLCGLSWGGLVALFMIDQRLGTWQSLTLLAPGLARRFALPWHDLIGIALSRSGRSSSRIPVALPLKPSMFTHISAQQKFIEQDPWRLQRVSRGFCRTTIALTRLVTQSNKSPSVPTLCLLAANDQIVDTARVKNLLMRRGVACEIVPAVEHSLILETPDLVAARLESQMSPRLTTRQQGATESHSLGAALQLTQMAIYRIKIPLRLHFRHARASHKEAESLILAMTLTNTETGKKAVGYGQVLPRSYLTGESLDDCWHSLQTIWWPRLQKLVLAADQAPFTALAPFYSEADASGSLAAYSGIDVAIFDAWGRLTGKNLGAFFSSYASMPPVIAPIPLNRSSKLGLWLWIKTLKHLGISAFKLKIDARTEAARILLCQKYCGPDTTLSLDANGSLTLNQAMTLVAALKDINANLDVFEEPLAPHSHAELQTLSQSHDLSLMADESLCSQADARQLVQHQSVQVFNLRLAKVGGFSGLRALAAIAATHKIRLRLGILVGESALLAAAALAANGLAKFEAQEFGFSQWLLRDDPFEGGPRWHEQAPRLKAQAKGLGVGLNRDTLKKLTVCTVRLSRDDVTS